MSRPAPYLPDPALTPGMITNAAAVAIAAGKAPPATPRRVTHATKRRVFMAYGIPDSDHSLYQIDHLIPLSLGGSNGELNLWPQPIVSTWDSDCKDRLENNVHALLHRGRIPPAEAINCWCANWVAAYRVLVQLDPNAGPWSAITTQAPRVQAAEPAALIA